jgi:sigma-B regulation protein RsbQ
MRGLLLYLWTSLLSLLVVSGASAASVDGMNIYATSTGSGKATLVMVHGWTCDSSSWDAQVPVLSKHYRVITLDLPGHGRSGAPKDGKFSMDLFARAVEAVRSEANADKVVLVGHSMGTPVVRQYARLYPQHVAALVLVDGVVAISGGAAPQPEQMSGPDGLSGRAQFIRGMFTAASPPALQERILKMMLAAPEATATGALIATLDPTNWNDDVMWRPVLGIYAEKSRYGNPVYSKKIFPAFEYVEIPGTGHFVMMEKPDEFNQLVITFVDGL